MSPRIEWNVHDEFGEPDEIILCYDDRFEFQEAVDLLSWPKDNGRGIHIDEGNATIRLEIADIMIGHKDNMIVKIGDDMDGVEPI